MKINRLLAKHEHTGRTEAQRLIAAGVVQINGSTIKDSLREVSRFDQVTLNGITIQDKEASLYVMLHKPDGYVSATKDAEHPTVIDLIDLPEKESLHIAGRLDRSTTGLVLLTNDGRWSKKLMDPQHKVPKTYLVETAEPILPDAVEAFAKGFYFHTEDLHTQPAELVILDERVARLTIHEGRYHQIKRMFHRTANRVVKLHRERIGTIHLPDDLPAGQWRLLTDEEVASSVHR